MAEDNWFGTVIGIGVGLILGVVITSLVLKSRQVSLAPPPIPQFYQSPPHYQSPPPQPQIYATPPTLMFVEKPAQVQKSEPAASTSYKNNESWEITRGPDGRIKNMKVIRDARASKE